MVKNAVDVIFGAFGYYICGFGISFGEHSVYLNGFTRFGYFLPDGNDGHLYAKYFFQLSFATTATTIVSGAMAERAKTYMFFSYVFPAHWVWDDKGFLKVLGVVDIAGCGPVHIVGGTAALVATVALKPRWKPSLTLSIKIFLLLYKNSKAICKEKEKVSVNVKVRLIPDHIRYLLQTTNQFKQLNSQAGSTRTHIADMQREIDKIQCSMKNVQLKTEICFENCETIPSNINTLEPLIGQKQKQISEIERKFKLSPQEDRNYLSVIKELKYSEMLAENLDIFTAEKLKKAEILKRKCCNGKTIWKIQNMLEKLHSIPITIYNSSPFFLSPQGYKYRVSFYKDFDHVTIRLTLIKSSFDAILTFPVTKNVKVTLINPRDKSKSFTREIVLNVHKRIDADDDDDDDDILYTSEMLQFIRVKDINNFCVNDVVYLQCHISPLY